MLPEGTGPHPTRRSPECVGPCAELRAAWPLHPVLRSSELGLDPPCPVSRELLFLPRPSVPPTQSSNSKPAGKEGRVCPCSPHGQLSRWMILFSLPEVCSVQLQGWCRVSPACSRHPDQGVDTVTSTQTSPCRSPLSPGQVACPASVPTHESCFFLASYKHRVVCSDGWGPALPHAAQAGGHRYGQTAWLPAPGCGLPCLCHFMDTGAPQGAPRVP